MRKFASFIEVWLRLEPGLAHRFTEDFLPVHENNPGAINFTMLVSANRTD